MPAAGVAFGGPEDEVGGRALEGAERGAVDGVDHDLHPRATGGHATEYAGLAAVGVDDVGFQFPQSPGQVPQRPPIGEGAHRADEVGDDDEPVRFVIEGRLQGAFGAGCGAGKEQ